MGLLAVSCGLRSGFELAGDEVDHRLCSYGLSGTRGRVALRRLDERVEPFEESVADAAVMPAGDPEPILVDHHRPLYDLTEPLLGRVTHNSALTEKANRRIPAPG